MARQIGIEKETDGFSAVPDRTAERHRAEIRTLLGFREATVADGEELADWLRDHAVAENRDVDQLEGVLKQRCRDLRIEPPAPERVERVVRAALHAYDDRFCREVHDRLSHSSRSSLDALLAVEVTERDADNCDDQEGSTPCSLIRLRADPGGPSVSSLQTELVKLDVVRKLELPADLFGHARSHEIELYRQRVAVQDPHELRRHSEPFRLTALAAYAHLRGRSRTDGLIDLLIETVHRIGVHAERKVERKLLDDLKRVTGKQNILFELADTSLAKPDGDVREVVFSAASEQTLRAW